jgi:type IV pilus biogenesis protein CpaD/CtpE
MAASFLETANFQPAITESLNQLDAMILNGDYWLDEAQRTSIGEFLARWTRVHAEHVIAAEDIQAANEL